MEANKIAIIIHATNEYAVNALIESLGKVNVPEGYLVDIIAIQSGVNEKYKTYNFAMRDSDAKYKIYLDEDIEILEKNFLSKIIEIFQSDENIGMIGCNGTTRLSTHGLVLQSLNRHGKILIEESKKFIELRQFDTDYLEAEIIDGFFMATQYDIPWREDLFASDFMGLSAQCVEFKRAGYKIVLARQEEPWYWCKITNLQITKQSIEIFLDEYSKDLFPSVLVLIPTYNRPQYFKEALESVLNQTYRNFEIVVSDDSANDETEKLIQPYLEKDSRIKYFRHHNFTADDNWNFLRQYQIDDKKSEYVNWLMDDDLFYPRKLELMVEVYRNNPDISLVTSIKNTINEAGKVTGKWMNLSDSTFKKSGEDMGKSIFILGNVIGFPGAVLIKKEFLRNGDLCWNDDEDGFYSLCDVSTWLQLLSKGNMVWIGEPLSAQRIHNKEATFWFKTRVIFAIAWAKLIYTAWEKKIFLKTEHDLKFAIYRWLAEHGCISMFDAYKKNYDFEEMKVLERIIIDMTQALSNGGKLDWSEGAVGRVKE